MLLFSGYDFFLAMNTPTLVSVDGDFRNKAITSTMARLQGTEYILE